MKPDSGLAPESDLLEHYPPSHGKNSHFFSGKRFISSQNSGGFGAVLPVPGCVASPSHLASLRRACLFEILGGTGGGLRKRVRCC